MTLLSCVNCCHNPLQSDSLGTSMGFCTEHRRVLLSPAQLTCGRHLRKDLTAPRAIVQRERHQARYTPSAVVRLDDPGRPANGGYTSRSLVMLRILFISDVGHYAPRTDPVHRLATFAEDAATATGVLSPKNLLGWLKREGVKLFDAALPEQKYDALATKLRSQHPD